MTPCRDGSQKLVQLFVTVEHAVRGEIVGRLHRPHPLAARLLPQRDMVPVDDATPRSPLRAHHQQPLSIPATHHPIPSHLLATRATPGGSRAPSTPASPR